MAHPKLRNLRRHEVRLDAEVRGAIVSRDEAERGARIEQVE